MAFRHPVVVICAGGRSKLSLIRPSHRKWFRLLDAVIGICILSSASLAAAILMPMVVLTRAGWRRRARTRLHDKPRSLLIVGYTTFSEAEAKGIMADPNLWYNCGESFDSVLVYVAFAANKEKRKITNRISYVQDGAIIPRLEIPFAWALLLVRYFRAWWRVCIFAYDADVMLVNGPNRSAQVALAAKVVTGIPALLFIEAFWEELLAGQTMHRWQRILTLWWYRLVYRAFDAYTGAPPFASSQYAGWGMKPERIFPYVHNVDVGALTIDASQARLPGLLKDRPRPWTITVGRLHPEKKPEAAVKLQAKLAQAGLPGTGILVGDGEARKKLEQLARDLGISNRVVFTGQLSQPEGMALAGASDFYFAPLQGNAMIEAMAAGSCIVAYDNRTHRAFVEDGVTAVFVAENDIEAAAESISELMANPSRASALREAARATAHKKYTAGNITEVWFSPLVSIYRASLL
jgi:glycosyltransferase involved in cell wall biosynthesis